MRLPHIPKLVLGLAAATLLLAGVYWLSNYNLNPPLAVPAWPGVKLTASSECLLLYHSQDEHIWTNMIVDPKFVYFTGYSNGVVMFVYWRDYSSNRSTWTAGIRLDVLIGLLAVVPALWLLREVGRRL